MRVRLKDGSEHELPVECALVLMKAGEVISAYTAAERAVAPSREYAVSLDAPCAHCR